MVLAVTDDYDQLRKASLEINKRMGDALQRDDLLRAGDGLGVLRSGTLVLRASNAMDVLMDVALHQRWGGTNAAERYLAEAGGQLSGPELRWAEASPRAQCRMLRVLRRLDAVRSEVQDLLTGERLLLADRGVAGTARSGATAVGYILEFPGFVAMSGGGVALPERAADVCATMLMTQGWPVGGAAMANLSPGDADALAIAALSLALAAKSALEDREDGEIDLPDALPHSPVPRARLQRRPARNAPCPCGSGRKHKSCCE